MKEWTGPNLAGCAYYDSDRARIASPYISRTQRSESRTVGGPINNNEIRPSTSLREMNFHFMALLGKRTMQGQFHKPAERLGAIATSRAKVAERLHELLPLLKTTGLTYLLATKGHGAAGRLLSAARPGRSL